MPQPPLGGGRLLRLPHPAGEDGADAADVPRCRRADERTPSWCTIDAERWWAETKPGYDPANRENIE
ncbi:MAG: hypothetical protein NTX35_13380 [Verrucomicrobia bacterium]|nr:hypothetical protein [Verrucomicrobiota bacterium]